MIFIVFFAAGLGIFAVLQLLSNYADTFFYPHMLCVKMAPHKSEFQELYQALVCGLKISKIEIKEQIKSLGIFHLFVISGTHLHFISLFIEKIFKNKTLSFVLLFFYCLSCGLQPPVVRAFSSQLVKIVNFKFKLGYKNIQCVVLSFLLLAPTFFVLKNFTSLLLSTLASLIVEATSSRFNSEFSKHVVIYILISVVFLPIQTLHPLTLLITYFVTPVICYFLIPLCILSIGIKDFHQFVDHIWRLMFYVFKQLSYLIPNFNPLSLQLSYSLFLLVILVSFYIILRPVK